MSSDAVADKVSNELHDNFDNTARVPRVRLAPSAIILKRQALIDGRLRDIRT